MALLKSFMTMVLVALYLFACRTPIGNKSILESRGGATRSSKLMASLYDRFVEICIKPSSAEYRVEQTQKTLAAIALWKTEIAKFAGNGLFEVNVGCSWWHDLTFDWQASPGRSHYREDGVITLNLRDTEGRKVSDEELKGTLLHEVGHAFGLADTYLEAGGIQPGQPPSLMSSSGVASLTADDRLGLKLSYAQWWGGKVQVSAPENMGHEDILELFPTKVGGDLTAPCFFLQFKRLQLALAAVDKTLVDALIKGSPQRDHWITLALTKAEPVYHFNPAPAKIFGSSAESVDARAATARL